ncbi:MAG: 30S ribosomal protein S6 [Bacilli bacterium]|nr:30S ribosomal protein S6 [Bacilli bacterium]
MKYEIMYIVRPDLEENVIKDVVKGFEKILTDNKAKITASKEMGQRRLAYEIKKYTSGYYYVYQIEVKDNKAIQEFDRLALINENIIRHLIIRLDD